ncbi:hypothetical protein B0T20DRAFT_492076 [Sordaria brevicollis]|uniref:Uncharacterized protein n=1 Tax=Sordaria brevicollis TaxID=83679 RepID=A0AAE0UFF3_SORBR|nr:hypothetical protein B0T20DRAFT_492076 [Sordaria brevicollis]
MPSRKVRARQSSQNTRGAEGNVDTLARSIRRNPEKYDLMILLCTPALTATMNIAPRDDPEQIKQAIATAESLQDRYERPFNPSLAFYVAASCSEFDLKAAYSVAFRGSAAGSTCDSEVHQMCWYQPLASDRHAAIKLAIAQALSIAETRLRTFSDGPHGAGMNTAKVAIFTDSRIALHHLIKDRIDGPRRGLHTRLRSLVLRQLEELGEIPRMLVEVEFYWIPANSDVILIREAKGLAWECRRKRQNDYYIEGQPSSEQNVSLPESISRDVRSDLQCERHRIKKERKKKERRMERRMEI